MIKLEIIAADDINRLGVYTFHKNILNIGTHSANELICQEEGIGKNHLSIFIEEDSLYSYPFNVEDTYHVNNKITHNKKRLAKGDTIKMAATEIKILEFSTSSFMKRKDFLNQKVSTLKNEDPEILQIIQKINEQS